MHLTGRILLIGFILAALILTGASESYLQSIEQGVEAYEDGRYDESVEHFNDAIINGGDPDILNYNLGNAQYMSSKYKDAESSYLKAVEQNEGDPDGLYNLGNSLAMQAESSAASGDFTSAIDTYGKAVEAYGKTLEANYTDVDAIHNLEYAKRRIEELKQQKEEQDQQGGGGDQQQGGEDSQDSGQSGDESSSDQQDESTSGESDTGGDQQQQDSSESSEQQEGQGEQKSESESQGQQKQQDDGLGLTDQQIESLLEYYEDRERRQEQGQGMIPFQPFGDDWEQGMWDDIFGVPPEDKDEWIDW